MYDATQFEKNVHDIFLKYFNDVVNNGDTIYTSVQSGEYKRSIVWPCPSAGSTMPKREKRGTP